MNAVKHKSWGNGTIVKREIYINGVYTEVKEGGNYITARFDDGKEIRFGIPRSFETGMLEALGDLKEEVDNAAVEMQRKREKEKDMYGVSDGVRPNDEVATRTVKRGVKIVLTGNLKKDFEIYLVESGYEQTVVYQYSRAIDIVCNEEKLSVENLMKKIMTTIKEYDKGGSKEKLGDYQKRTVINALKRLHEFAKINTPTNVVTW